MIPLEVVIRTDASRTIGSGHVIRCLTLATALRARGAHVRFVTREHEGHLAAMIESRGFECARLPIAHALATPANGAPVADYAQWLGCTQDDDARETVRALGGKPAIDWLIVDHYALDAQWETIMRTHTRRIMVIDDLANRQHDCDALLDQNLFAERETRYVSRVPPSCDLFLGPRYALLSPALAKERQIVQSKRLVAPWRLLVFFGGVDATNETSRFLEAWSRIARTDLSADVIIGVANTNATALLDQAARLPGIRAHRHVDNLAQLMAQSDYAFGASGATNWERFCLGVNCTLTGVAENQLQLAQDLAALGLVDYLGDWRQSSVDTYEAALEKLAPSSETLLRRRVQIMSYVDGLGVERVAQHLIETGAEACNSDR